MSVCPVSVRSGGACGFDIADADLTLVWRSMSATVRVMFTRDAIDRLRARATAMSSGEACARRLAMGHAAAQLSQAALTLSPAEPPRAQR